MYERLPTQERHCHSTSISLGISSRRVAIIGWRFLVLLAVLLGASSFILRYLLLNNIDNNYFNFLED